MSNVMDYLVDWMINNKIIEEDEREVYIYGVRQSIFIVINLLTAITLGYIFDLTIQIVVFWGAYIPIRSYAGGYHAKTPLRCYMFSIGMILSIILGFKWIPLKGYVYLYILIVSAINILRLAPVEDCNKLLNEREKVAYARRTKVILSVLSIGAVFLWCMKLEEISASIVLALLAVGIMLQLGTK